MVYDAAAACLPADALIVSVEDVTERSAMVPQIPESGYWMYDYSCPEGTFITRFFGKAGTYINTLTAQCGRVWNLKQVTTRAVLYTVFLYLLSSCI
jgi:hypothetical protein